MQAEAKAGSGSRPGMCSLTQLAMRQTTAGSGVVERKWSKATVTYDCNTFTGDIETAQNA